MLTPQEYGKLASAIDDAMDVHEALIKDPSAKAAYDFTEACQHMEALLLCFTNTDVPKRLVGACSIQSPETK